MIEGVGIDIVENDRIASLLDRYGNRFLNRIYTDEEIKYAYSHSDPIPPLAARFAAREATIKALNLIAGSGQIKLHYKDFYVIGAVHGKKQLKIAGEAGEYLKQKGVNRIHFSISHGVASSVAIVILESGGEP